MRWPRGRQEVPAYVILLANKPREIKITSLLIVPADDLGRVWSVSRGSNANMFNNYCTPDGYRTFVNSSHLCPTLAQDWEKSPSYLIAVKWMLHRKDWLVTEGYGVSRIEPVVYLFCSQPLATQPLLRGHIGAHSFQHRPWKKSHHQQWADMLNVQGFYFSFLILIFSALILNLYGLYLLLFTNFYHSDASLIFWF